MKLEFKLGIITNGFLLLAMGCAHNAPAPKVSDNGGPPNPAAHLAWCKGNQAQDCFEVAATFCDRKASEGFSYQSSQVGHGSWHQVVEPDSGMHFPAMVKDNGGWSFWFQCDE